MIFGTTEIVICVGLFTLVAFAICLGLVAANISANRARDVKVCPYCAEIVRSKAVRCPSCGKDLII
jgi:hypothetical protein